MLRTTSGLSRSVLKWVSQVAASLGATLSATLIWSAVPHPGAVPAPPPELTSGGKFAARAVQPVAYDGLDTMPLPHVAPALVRFAPGPAEAMGSADPAPANSMGLAAAALANPMGLAPPVPAEAAPGPTLHRAAWEEPSPVRTVRPAHPPVRTETRRVEPPSRAAAGPAPVTVAETARPEPDARADQGILQRVIPSALPRILPGLVSTARDAWTVTASAGDMLVSHVLPQLP